jgi:hypothetical protein
MKNFWDPHINRIEKILVKFCPKSKFLNLYSSIYNKARPFFVKLSSFCTLLFHFQEDFAAKTPEREKDVLKEGWLELKINEVNFES